MEAYKVWVTLNLKGDALKKMEMFTAATKRATTAVDKLKIAMKPNLSMFDQMAVNLREINPELNKMASNINKIDAASKRMGRSTGRGSGALSNIGIGMGLMNPYVMAGMAAGAVGVRGWHQGASYSRQMGQIAAMGYGNSQLDYIKNFTSQAMPGISQSDQAEAFKDALMATQSFSMSKMLAPIIAQNKYASSMYGGMSEKQVQSSIKTAEMIGGSNPQKVAKALTTVLQMTALSGGTIMPTEQRSFMRQAAGAASRLTPEGYLSLEPVMQELGGSKTGTALTTGLRAFSNPKISHFARYQVDNLKKFGLWDDKTNRMKQNYLELLQTDPSQFAQIWLSNLAGKGVTSDSGVLTETMSSFPRTFGTLMSLLIKNMDKITRERAIISGLPAGEGLSGIFSHTQAGAQLRLSKSFDSFSKSINDLSSPSVISGMNILAKLFERLANVINKFENIPWITPEASGAIDRTMHSVNKAANMAYTTVVNLDGKHLATVVANKMGQVTTGHQTVQHGVSGVNPLSPYPNSIR